MRPRVALPVTVHTPDREPADVERSLAELALLLRGLGFEVAPPLVQRRPRPEPATYLGAGKLAALAAQTGGPGAPARGPQPHAPVDPGAPTVVVVDDDLGAAQRRNLESACAAPVLDRTDVILQVFATRARTRTAQLEVEIARLEHELPRVRDDHALGDREGGGGRASRGASNVDLKKKRARDRIATLRRTLERARQEQERQRAARVVQPRVAIVGYTNTGKSSLLNAITTGGVLAQDRLFATLGTTVRRLALHREPPVLVTDTVGFLSRLPHALLASFRSTLEEARDADLVLHVADAADPARHEQRKVTAEVLADVGARAPVWLVLNKIDRLSEPARAALAAEVPEAILMSALERSDARALVERIDAHFCARVSRP